MGTQATRFHTRWLLIDTVRGSGEWGWKAKIVLSAAARREIEFWMENMDALNGRSFRSEDKVMVIKTGDVRGGSDAGGQQVGGALFRDKKPQDQQG